MGFLTINHGVPEPQAPRDPSTIERSEPAFDMAASAPPVSPFSWRNVFDAARYPWAFPDVEMHRHLGIWPSNDPVLSQADAARYLELDLNTFRANEQRLRIPVFAKYRDLDGFQKTTWTDASTALCARAYEVTYSAFALELWKALNDPLRADRIGTHIPGSRR